MTGIEHVLPDSGFSNVSGKRGHPLALFRSTHDIVWLEEAEVNGEKISNRKSKAKMRYKAI
ncbi:hypothetical protein D3C81_1652110 [compost metagenome]